jgi:hypothetical protein
MLKKLAMVAIAGILTACAQPHYVYHQQPRVYVEQYTVHPSRYAQCELYLRRHANCSKMRTTYDERVCQNNEMTYYNACLAR